MHSLSYVEALGNDLQAVLPDWTAELFGLPIDRLATELERARLGWGRIAHAIRADPSRYHRAVLVRTPEFEVIAATWLPGQASPIHDHGGSEGATRILRGTLTEGLFEAVGDRARRVRQRVHPEGAVFVERNQTLHQVVNPGPEIAVSLHLYRPPKAQMRTYAAES